jgi:hypothetical protein
LLLAGGEHLRRLKLPHPSSAQVIEATDVSRSRAYELCDALRAGLPSLLRPVGRPPAEPDAPEASLAAAHTLSLAVLRFVMDHPGSVYGGSDRQRYSDAFRRFALALREQHTDLALEVFAAATLVPLGTLKQWLGAGAGACPTGEDSSDQEDKGACASATDTTPASAQIEAVLACWKTWSGSFADFCEHVRHEQRIPFRRTLLAHLLFAHGVRRPRRRAGRSPDEQALRGSFETFFGGAQWVGDGSPIDVTVAGQRFSFNLELMVDAKSGGFVGMSVRDAEDSAAVTLAVHDGIATTGKAPLAVLLDNRPSNHTSEVDAALGDSTLRMRATTGRPQNKAHGEGAFGLFQQTVPALEIDASCPRDVGRQLLMLTAQTWARTLNHRPRTDRGGRSRVELYRDEPTADQIDHARAALNERCRKQELARATASARQDPLVRALLDEAFERLALLDPERNLRVAIARYPLDVVVNALAIFEAKRRVHMLPSGVDARYLLGIVRNLGDEREGIAIAEQMLRARLDARDRMLAPLVQARDAARDDTPDLRERVLRFVDLALAAERRIDRFFWLLATAEAINVGPKGDPAPLVHAAARRIHATHRVTYRERLDAARFLIANVAPLD